MSRTVKEKRARFRELHQSGCFILPNPWDVGSARMLESLGFEALASTSTGYAWSTGRPDTLSLGMTCWSTSQLWPTASICP